jgi:hypothetical protein
MPVTPRPPFTSAIVVILYLVGLRGARKVAGMRWEELAGKRCANLIVPRMSVFSCGAHCTTFFPEPVEAKGFGKAMTLRGFLGFVAPIVV